MRRPGGCSRPWRPGCRRRRLVVDPSLRGGDQFGANLSELVAQLDSLLQRQEKRLSFQTTMKSRALSSRVASDIILVNSSLVPAVSLNVAQTVRSLGKQYSRQVVSWSSLEMMLPIIVRESLT